MTQPPHAESRLLERLHLINPVVTHTSDAVIVSSAALLTVVDVTLWATDPVVDFGRLSISIAILVPCLGVFATLAIAFRRRNLATVLIALTSISMALTIACWVIGTNLPPSFAALYAVALLTTRALRHEPERSAVLLTALGALAVAAESLRPMVSAAAYLLVVCQGAFGIAVGIGVYLRWTDWRQIAIGNAARVEVRLEIARDLHDMVGHYVTGIIVQAQAARHVADRQPDGATAALARIEGAGNEAMAAMRSMVSGLRDDFSTDPSYTWDQIDTLLADAVAHGEPIQATIDPIVRATEAALAPSVWRIVSESLTNVRCHACEVTHIDVEVVRSSRHLIVTVSNDGRLARSAIPKTPSRGSFGIIGMSERATALGGSLEAGPTPDGGWRVRAKLRCTSNVTEHI